jgi:hypothetical protein
MSEDRANESAAWAAPPFRDTFRDVDNVNVTNEITYANDLKSAQMISYG